jgi:hypothetical protein
LQPSRIQCRVDLYRVTKFWEDLAAFISRVAQKEFNLVFFFTVRFFYEAKLKIHQCSPKCNKAHLQNTVQFSLSHATLLKYVSVNTKKAITVSYDIHNAIITASSADVFDVGIADITLYMSTKTTSRFDSNAKQAYDL